MHTRQRFLNPKKRLGCTKCKKTYSLDRSYPRCENCGEPLEVEKVVKGKIGEGSHLQQTILERYSDFFPFERINEEISLHEGFTPLTCSTRIASELNLKNIFFKNETKNPTWSFKDRGTLLAIQHAISLGYRRIGTVSTGNMAASVAAYGARARFETYVFVPADFPREKINPIAIYHPYLVMVEGDYGDLYFKTLELGQRFGVYFINSDVPFRIEGSKSIAYEICEQMGFSPPDYVAVPVSAGGNIRGILKGFEEFYQVGLIERIPRMIACQAAGCSPIVSAFELGNATIERVSDPNTIAHAIENPFPPSGNEVLRKLNENEGMAVKVNDDQILDAQVLLAKEGIFGQPAAALPLAAVKTLVFEKHLKPTDSVICVVTGGGLKSTAVLELHRFKTKRVRLERLEEVFD